MAQNTAVARSYNAAELKAQDVRENCGPAPVDHAAQAALENTELTGDGFQTAYSEVFQTVNHFMSEYNASEAAEKIRRLKVELQ